VELDPAKAAAGIISHIALKRKALGI
jgi:hydroxylamine reductase (hybrid-cluster protein)